MISKLRFSLVAVIMLVLLGFGFHNQAQAQPGTDGLFCPDVPNTTGWLDVRVEAAPGLPFPDFSGALIGSVESLLGGPLHGGMDWQHVDFTSFFSPTPTNELGSQLVSWWSQTNGRNTYLQVTNAIGNTEDAGTWVHVHVFNQDCVEIRNFCDFYTEFDTHVYNFGDMVTNNGQPVGDFSDQEGFVTVTAVNGCPDPDLAIEHDWLGGNTFVKSVSSTDYMYGFATYHRQGVCFDLTLTETVNRIENGSFQNGPNFGPWTVNQGNGAGVSNVNISPDIEIPPASGPDADNNQSNVFVGFAASSSLNGDQSGWYGTNVNFSPTPGFPFPELANDIGDDCAGGGCLINSNQGLFETNVTVVTSNVFTTTGENTVFYDVSLLQPSDTIVPVFGEACDNYVAVCVIETSGVFPDDSASFEDCTCYNEQGNGFISSVEGGDKPCENMGSNNLVYNVDSIAGNFTFDGGLSAFATDEELVISDASTYVVQFITGQIANLACQNNVPNGGFNANTGTFVDNFRKLETVTETLECDGILDGSENAFLDVIVPNLFAGQFDAQDGTAGADVVHINFFDEYLPNYTPQAAFINAVVGIWNDTEQFLSCGETQVCFVRLGVDDALVLSDNFVGPPTTAPPTTPPTLGPTTAPPTLTPTTGGGGGSGSCAIAGNPVQLGTAFANVLIPLVPVAFVFGIRAMRRRKK